MRAVCIARHRILSDHLCAYFAPLGVDASPAVGFENGARLARAARVDLVLCDCDLCGAAQLERWARDPVLATTPIVAVSLTRRREEAHLTDATGIAGFLYLPTLREEDATRLLRAFAGRGLHAPVGALRWPSSPHEPQRRP
jgi:CheY-like chemotaxis protein